MGFGSSLHSKILWGQQKSFFPQSKIHPPTFTPQHNKLTLVYYGSLWQYWWQALSIDSFCMRFNVLVKTEAKTALFLLACTNTPTRPCTITHLLPKWLQGLMQDPLADNPLSYYPKACCREGFLYVFNIMPVLHTYPADLVLGSACQSHSVILTGYSLLMWCGALVYKWTQRFGSLCSSSCLVWCCGPVLWRPSMVNSDPLPLLRPPSWDFAGQMPGSPGHTKTLLTHGGQEKPCGAFYHSALRGAIFQHSLLLLISSFLKSERCVCFTASVSSVLPPLTQALRSPCSKMGWVQSSKIPPQFLICSLPDSLFYSSLPGPWGLLLVWAFPPWAVSYS